MVVMLWVVVTGWVVGRYIANVMVLEAKEGRRKGRMEGGREGGKG